MDEHAKSHVGKFYLTQSTSDYNWGMPISDSPIGAAGSYIYNMWPITTLAKSPVIQVPSAGGESGKRYVNHHTWDASWETTCVLASDRKSDATEVVQKFVPKLKAVVKVSQQSYIETQVLLGNTPKEAYDAYQEMTSGLDRPVGQVSEPIQFMGTGASRKIIFPGDLLYPTATSIFTGLLEDAREGTDEGLGHVGEAGSGQGTVK